MGRRLVPGRLYLDAQREVVELRARHRSLTAREREVMALLAAGGRQQAGELAVSAVTIRLHRLQVMRKMQVGSPN